jgi:histone acetyltransferase (RNA polymerase elongator complex component)
MNETNRNHVCKVRLNDEELQLFQKKSQSYGGNTSAMIRDAVNRFDDKRTRGRIEAMTTLLSFYNKYQQQLSWLGGNFNQVMHRANELAIDDKLNESYFHKVIMPQAQSTLKAIRGIKAELDTIHEHLEKCNPFYS